MASWHAKDMADKNYFSHTDSLGRPPGGPGTGSRGYQCDTAGGIGENIAAGTAWDTAQDAFNAWRNSPGHHTNMLNASYRQIGIARHFNSAAQYDWYWVTDFSVNNDGTNIGGGGTPPPPPPPPPPAPPPPPPPPPGPPPPPPGPTIVTTNYHDCDVSVPRPTGDDNGYETNGMGACANGGSVAIDSNSGTNTTRSIADTTSSCQLMPLSRESKYGSTPGLTHLLASPVSASSFSPAAAPARRPDIPLSLAAARRP
jgi:hypothetical protein